MQKNVEWNRGLCLQILLKRVCTHQQFATVQDPVNGVRSVACEETAQVICKNCNTRSVSVSLPRQEIWLKATVFVFTRLKRWQSASPMFLLSSHCRFFFLSLFFLLWKCTKSYAEGQIFPPGQSEVRQREKPEQIWPRHITSAVWGSAACG